MFESHKITIESNGIRYKPGTRQPTGGYDKVGEHVPCHIGRTGTSSILKLYMLKKYYNGLTEKLNRGFRITDEDTGAKYELSQIPIWAGGLKHHIECTLEEAK
jgi:hypothetical protein